MDKKKIIKGMVGVGSKAATVAGAIKGMSQIKSADQSKSLPSISQGIVPNKMTSPLGRSIGRTIRKTIDRTPRTSPYKGKTSMPLPKSPKSIPLPKSLPMPAKKDIIKKGMGGCGKGGVTQPFQTLGKVVKSAGKAAVSGFKKAYKSNVSKYDKESSGIRMPDTKAKAAIKGVIYGAGKGIQSLIKKNK